VDRLAAACSWIFNSLMEFLVTYIYFVPQIFDFMKIQTTTTLSSEIAGSVMNW
jgi:hypothetical protein